MMNKVIDLAVNQNIGYEKVERLSFETFISRYIPLKKPGLIETTGSFTEDFVLSSGKVEDMKIALEAMDKHPSKVWTYYEDGVVSWLGSEIGFVNRAGYVVTDIAYDDGKLIQAHDDYYVNNSKIVLTCDLGIDSDSIEDLLTDMMDQFRVDARLGILDINMNFEWLHKQYNSFLVAEVDMLFDDDEPSEAEIISVHTMLNTLGKQLLRDNKQIRLLHHENLNTHCYFGEKSFTDTPVMNCRKCSYTNANHDWLDDGETCPKCLLVN